MEGRSARCPGSEGVAAGALAPEDACGDLTVLRSWAQRRGPLPEFLSACSTGPLCVSPAVAKMKAAAATVGQFQRIESSRFSAACE